MGQIIDKILDEIVRLFQVGSKDNLIIKQTIGKGFSGAEVYLIELTGNSVYRGNFFLKIDEDDKEYENAKKGYCFNNVAKIVKYYEIGKYYVMLMQIAGKSSLEFQAFYELEKVTDRRTAVETIIPDILNAEAKDKNYVVGNIIPSELFKKHLDNKLSKTGELIKYVSLLTAGERIESVTGFLLPEDIILPNALSYVLCNGLWEGKTLTDTSFYVHGDLHGNNVFYCPKNKEYALIDLALYHDEGFAFFDTAYFEISLLLHDFLSENNLWWINLICNMSDQKWELIDCNDKQVFKSIQDCEKSWINMQCDEKFNYKDNLLESQYIARVLAGLNFAGKKMVKNEIRRKSFLYACVYMKKLLKAKAIYNYNNETIVWNEISHNSSDIETSKFLSDVENFNNSQKYILVLGNNFNYKESVCEALSRIKWTGLVSFKRTVGIENILKKYNILNVLTVDDDLDMLTTENMWCLYADGVDYKPETLKNGFPQWRKKYMPFFNAFSEKLDQIIAPDELQIIVDLDSFSKEYIEHLKRFCESIDLIENMHVNISFLLKGKNKICGKEDFAQVDCISYRTDIESIAEFCLIYLKGVREGEVTVPALDNARRVVPDSDYKFIKSYVTLLHNRILQFEGTITEVEKRAFYYGKKILWQSIEEKLYIDRTEIEDYEKNINIELEKDENQFLIHIFHKPGAGASVLCRILAWKFRNMYPVILAEEMNTQISECIQKLYSISGKRVLLFLDGDFTENDVKQLMKRARDYGVKIGCVVSCRRYSNIESGLSILSVNDGLKFSSGYSFQMRKIMNYSEKLIQERSVNMHELATQNSLINYRMPFFFGINAFEKDLVSIQEYLYRIANFIDSSNIYRNIINYIALITYYTEGQGLRLGYVKKILKLKTKISIKDILKEINGETSDFIYYTNGVFKICHSIVALEILNHTYLRSSLEFEEFLEKFVQDICNCQKQGNMSDELNELLMNLFIKRDIEGDITNNLQKNNFSQIILDLENNNLQEKFFGFLVKQVPNNAHFRQHYGRLIIYNNPGKLESAKEQFDKAIELDPTNPLHYHARGNMYTKYVMNLCRSNYKDIGCQELFDKIKLIVEIAISDYEICIKLINDAKDLTIDISYPYASIIQTITYVVHQLFLYHDMKGEEKQFLLLNNNISIWCRDLIQKAEQYDMNTENRYDSVRDNDVYRNVRKYLVKYKSAHSEISEQLKKTPDDIRIIKDFLYTLDTKKETWENKSQDEIKNIIYCSKKLIIDQAESSDGVLWRWFNGCLNYKKNNRTEMLAILETRPNTNTSLTIQFMLYTIKLGHFLQCLDNRLVLEINEHISNCKELSGNSNRTSSRYYYCGIGEVGFCYDKEKSIYVNGTVTRWDSPQNGHVSLDANPSLQAFFVPSIINMRQEGGVGTKVRFKIGVSFDGLRAWEVEDLE